MDDTRSSEAVREQGERLEVIERLRPAPPERDSSGGYEIKPPREASGPDS